MATVAESTTEIENDADFWHYMAYSMVKRWNKSGTVGHVWLFLREILCNSVIQYGPILYPNTELARNKQF